MDDDLQVGDGLIIGHRHPLELAIERGRRYLAKRGDGVAGSGRIGGVGFDEEDRAVAAHHARFEVAGNRHQKQDRAFGDQIFGFFDAPGDVIEAVVTGIFECRCDCMGETAVADGEQRCRQCFRIGVDCESEEQKLNERYAEHHAESQTVAPHLDELLGENGKEPRE